MQADRAAERAVLAGICNYGSAGLAEVSDIINVETFTDDFNKTVFRCVEHALSLSDSDRLDWPTIQSSAYSLGLGPTFTAQPQFLNEFTKTVRGVINCPIELSSVRKLAAKIKKFEIIKDLQAKLNKSKTNLEKLTGDEPIDKILSLAQEPIFEFDAKLNQDTNSSPIHISQGSDELFQNLIDNPVTMLGISSGFPVWDEFLGGGLQNGTVTLVGARTKMGKSVFADNVAIHVSLKLGIPVLMLDTEMDQNRHLFRIWANMSGVSINEIKTGKFSLDKNKQEKVYIAKEQLKESGYNYINVAGKPFEECLSIMRRWLKRSVGTDDSGRVNPCLIIYDYLKLMNAEGLSNDTKEYQLLGFHSTALHDFASQNQIPCLTFAQLNREKSISGSDRQTWLADNLTYLDDFSEDELATGIKYSRRLIPVHCRDGEFPEGDYINIDFQGKYAKMTECGTKSAGRTPQNTKAKLEGFEINDDAAGEQEF